MKQLWKRFLSAPGAITTLLIFKLLENKNNSTQFFEKNFSTRASYAGFFCK